MIPTVTILTYCAHPALAYGTLLVFKTLRTGFPTARVEVYDNGSHPEVRDQIMKAAADAGATFTAMQPKHYADHYEWLLLEREHDGGPLVLLDPDVLFWDSIEDWDFADSLIAGRLIPEQREGVYTSLPRLHPSLFWVPSVERLREAVAELDPRWDAIGCTLRREAGCIAVRDTLAPLYEKFKAYSSPFSAAKLDRYDHLFHGSHLSFNAACKYEGFEAISAAHEAVIGGDLKQAKGIWRGQQAYFERAHVPALQASKRSSGVLAHLKELSASQGIDADEAALIDAVNLLSIRMQLMARATKRSLIGI